MCQKEYVRGLEATEGNLRVELVVAVNPDGTGVEGVADTVGTGEVLGEDTRGKTVDGVVGGLDDLLLSLELGDDDDGAEDLLLDDLHVGLDVGEDGGLDEVAGLAVADTTGEDVGTLLLAALNVVHDAVVLGLRDLGALEGSGVEGVTDSDLLRDGLELLDELVVDALLDVDTRTSAAGLAVVEEDTLGGVADGVVEDTVVEDDVGTLATELEGDLLEVGLGSGLEDLAADSGGASEGDLVDLLRRGEGVTDSLAVTGDNVDNSVGEASLLDELGHVAGSEGGELRGLDDDGAAGGEGGSELPGEHEEGEVPGDDLTTDTDGLVAGEDDLVGGLLNDLAVDLVGPATVVAEASGGLGDVEAAGGTEGLAVVEGLKRGEDVGVTLNELGELDQELSALEAGGVEAPGGVVGLAGGVDGDIDVSLGTLGEVDDLLAGGGVDDTGGLARCSDKSGCMQW